MSNPAHEPSPKTRTNRHREVRQLSWSQVSPQLLAHFITNCTDDGMAVLFTRTRDGGTLVAQVLNGETKLKDYISEPHEALTVLNWLLDDCGLLQYTEQPKSK